MLNNTRFIRQKVESLLWRMSKSAYDELSEMQFYHYYASVME